MIKAVIFNGTGVLSDPTPFIHKARVIYLKKLGIEHKTGNVSEILGQSLKEQIIFYNKKYGIDLKWDEFSKETAKIANDLMKGNLKANPGAKELLKDLIKNKVKIATASQNIRKNIDFYLEEVGIKEKFDAITTVEELTKFKPDPQIFEITCKKLNVKPEECVMIDDSLFGFEPAKRLGIKTIGIASKFQDKKKLEKVADIVIDSLEELSYEKINRL